jgi:hypothetical protein
MRRLALPVIGVVVAGMMSAVPAAGQDVAHPAHIHEGVCPAPGAIVATLGDVTADFTVEGAAAAGALPVGADPTSPIMASATTTDLPLATIVASDHSIVVHASAAEMGTYLVCGNIGGRTMADTQLPIALGQVGGSGYSGVALLEGTAADTTLITVYLAAAGASQPSVAASPNASPAPAASDSLAPTTVVLDQPLQFSGYDIEVQEVTFDPVLGTVEVSATFGNTGTGTANLTALQLSARPAIVSGTTSVPLKLLTSGLVPGGTAVSDKLVTTGALPDGFALDDAVLTFGAADQHQATLPLRAGAPGTYLPVQAFKVPRDARSLRLKGLAKVTIDSARLVPANCGGRPDEVTFEPALATEMALVLSVTIEGSAPSGAIIGSYVTVPDGTSSVGGPGATAVYRGDTLRDITLCYRVPAPADGRYRWRIESGDRRASSRFTVPAPESP